MILIVTCCEDVHANKLQASLTRRDVPHFRVNVDQFPNNYDVEFSASNNVTLLHSKPVLDGVLTDLTQHTEARLSDVHAIWLRKTFSFYAELGENLAANGMMTQVEMDTEQAVMSGLYALDCYWMSHPKYLYTSRWRGEQLQRAVRMGFRVPDSLITNRSDAAVSFLENCRDGAVVRPLSLSLQVNSSLSPCPNEPPEIQFQTAAELLQSDMFTRDKATGVAHPWLLQAKISALFELRVVVVDQQVFATKLAPAEEGEASQASRRHTDLYLLPDTIRRSCVGFVRSYGLTYGVMRLLKTTSNEYVFLENNPAGGFLDMEQSFPELNITETLAGTLIEGHI